MKVLVVGKYPPIEGGTATQTLAAVRGLAQRGHDVHVLTNADETEPSCRQIFLPGDKQMLAAFSAPGGNGSVTVHQSSFVREASYIPWAQPYLSKLFGIGTYLTTGTAFDLVVGWYMEPYGLAAALIAQAAEVPLLLTHAGSDVGRLARHMDLRLAYRWAFRRADYVLTSPGHVDSVIDLGARPETVVMGFGGGGLPDYFSDPFSPVDLEELAQPALGHFEMLEPPEPISEMLRAALERRPILGQRPVIGIYGKVGEVKGSFDLLGALERLASEGHAFTLLGAVGGQPHAFYPFVEALEAAEHLRERSVLVPFLAPWRVPHLLDACDLVCFLERRFSISEHSPLVPAEVLKRRRALAVSAEIANKLWFRERLVDGETHILVPDPTDVPSLADRLRPFVSAPERLHRIGERGGALAEELYGWRRSDGAAPVIDDVLASLA